MEHYPDLPAQPTSSASNRSGKPVKRKLFTKDEAPDALPSAEKVVPKTDSPSNDAFVENEPAVSNIKQGVLNKYLGSWFPTHRNNPFRTSGRYSTRAQYSRIVYVDGFAGPGVYENGEFDSPAALVYNLALTHKNLGDHGPPILPIFVESNPATCDKLLTILIGLRNKNAEAENAGKVHFMVIGAEFADAMEWILSPAFQFPVDYTKQVFQVPVVAQSPCDLPFIGRETPLLVSADPVGYNGQEMPISTMRAIMSASTNSELFLNLMPGSPAMDDNDGSDASWKGSVLEGVDAKEKLKKFLQRYTANLEEGCNQTLFTGLFEMRNERNMLLYNLYYATHHPTGFQTMKKAVQKESDDHAVQFSVFDGKHPTFEVKPVNMEELEEMILKKFEGKYTFGEDIARFIKRDPHLDKQFRTPLKNQLKKFCVSPKSVKKFDEQTFYFSRNMVREESGVEQG